MVTRGVFFDDGSWHPIPYVDSLKAETLFRHKVLRALRQRDLITQERIELLLSWRNSGFGVHNRTTVYPADTEGLHKLACDFMRPPVSLSRLFSAVVVLACGVGCQSSSADVSTDAPPLSALYDTPDELALAFLEALESRDVATLRSFALSEEEFRRHVWPELPASRPERGISFDYGWQDLSQKSSNALRRTYSRYGGRRLEFVEIRFEGETTRYLSFSVHRDARVKVRTEAGNETWLDLFGSVLERDGKYKLFSYVTD